jgi:short-subunit dehydrogenase
MNLRWPFAVLLPVLLLGAGLAGCASPVQLTHGEQRHVSTQTFVVTGASSGFGRGVALKLGSYGSNVVLAARRKEVLEQVAAEVRAAGGTPLVVATDVSRPDNIERLAAAAMRRFGRIDVWINNAGVGAIGRFEEVPLRDYDRVIDVNLKGVVYGSHTALRLFRQQGFGTIVNISSVEGEVPLAYQAIYSASKHAVNGLGAALKQELRLNRLETIKVVTVMPWAADTPFFEHAANYSGGTPRMILMDDPQTVVDTIVSASIYPRKEVAVGWKAQAAVTAHRLLPDLTEQIAADAYHRVQIETAPPAPPTSGTLHQPMRSGTTVEGGVRERMRQEDQQRLERYGS